MCYHAVFGGSALKGEGTNTGKNPNWGALELGCLRMEGVADPRYTHLPTCYHVKIGSSASKGVCINRREPQNWGALGHRPFR